MTERTRFQICLSLSSILHALPVLLILFLGGGDGGDDGKGKKKGQGDADTSTISDKPNDMVTEVSIIHVKGQHTVQKPAHAEDQCEQFYGGIGIMHDMSDRVITYVGKGYPADLAGIKEGDLIITPVGTIRGEVGTEIEIDYVSMPDGVVHNVKLIRDKICTSPPPQPGPGSGP